MKLSNEEKIFIQKMSAVAKKDKSTVMDLLLTNIFAMTKELYKGNKTFYIPYICKITIEEKSYLDVKDNSEKVKVILHAEPCESFLEELDSIRKDEITPSEKYIKKQIANRFMKLLEIDDMDFEIE